LLYYFVSDLTAITINRLLDYAGDRLSDVITVLPVSRAETLETLEPANILFTDIERLGLLAHHTATIWNKYKIRAPEANNFNHPTLSMSRFELLRNLYKSDINKFNIYHPWEMTHTIRLPVFIRRKNDHFGPRSPLIYNFEMLNRYLHESMKIYPRDEIMIVEYIDTADEQGIFRKYAAILAGDTFIPTHLHFSNDWAVKNAALKEDALTMEELDFVSIPCIHEQEIRDIFRMADIDYGRIDYSTYDGKIQVWEINSNPMIVGENIPTGLKKEVFDMVVPSVIDALRTMASTPLSH